MKKVILGLVVGLFAASAFALTPKSDLVGKQFISNDKACRVSISKDESWKIECDHLKRKYQQSVLTGQGLKIFNCYEEASCEGVEFQGRFKRPLQAFILKDENLKGFNLGLVYGSPADGEVELLNQF